MNVIFMNTRRRVAFSLKTFWFQLKVLVQTNYDKSVQYNDASNKVRKWHLSERI